MSQPIQARRPDDVSSRLTWDLARDASNRHAPDLRITPTRGDVACAQCGNAWPCRARDTADDTMRLMEQCPDDAVAGFLPGADYATAAVTAHIPAVINS